MQSSRATDPNKLEGGYSAQPVFCGRGAAVCWAISGQLDAGRVRPGADRRRLGGDSDRASLPGGRIGAPFLRSARTHGKPPFLSAARAIVAWLPSHGRKGTAEFSAFAGARCKIASFTTPSQLGGARIAKAAIDAAGRRAGPAGRPGGRPPFGARVRPYAGRAGQTTISGNTRGAALPRDPECDHAALARARNISPGPMGSGVRAAAIVAGSGAKSAALTMGFGGLAEHGRAFGGDSEGKAEGGRA